VNHPTKGHIKVAYWLLNRAFRKMFREAADILKKKKKALYGSINYFKICIIMQVIYCRMHMFNATLISAQYHGFP